MKIKIKCFFCLLPIILCLTSIAQAGEKYYAFVGEVSYIDDQNYILSDSVQVGIPEGSGVKNFFCDYFSRSCLNSINGGSFNKGDHFSEYNYGLNVTHQETGKQTGDLYEMSRMIRLASILIFFGSKN
jgi:hypothetical protein